MKRFMVVLAAMALVFIMVGSAFATNTTTTVKSTAGIANACQLGGTGTIAFGDLNQVTGLPVSNVDATGYTLWCTKDYSAAISITDGGNYSGGTRNLKNKTNAELIPYTLAWTTPVTGTGKSNNIMSAVALKGTIAEGAYADVSAGAYEDTVTITISY